VEPNSRITTGPRADAPKWATPMIAPSNPTYRSHRNSAAAPILTRARTLGGNRRSSSYTLLTDSVMSTLETPHRGQLNLGFSDDRSSAIEIAEKVCDSDERVGAPVRQGWGVSAVSSACVSIVGDA
jgi:hypothetical protein